MSEVTETPTECPATIMVKEGRRHFICGEYVQAVEKLSEACEKMAEKHGEGNSVLAPIFYSYGEALLEMARMETPVLGNALKDVPEVIAESDDKPEEKGESEEKDESLDEDAKEDIADKVIEALCEAPVMDGQENKSNVDENKESDESDKKTDEASEDAKEKTDAKDEKNEDNKSSANNGEKESDKMETDAEKTEGSKEKEDENKDKPDETEEAEEDDDEDIEEGDDDTEGNAEGEENTAEAEENDVGHLQLAWEIIEVARNLFVKKSESETDKEEINKAKLKIADCHKKLGEVLMERDEWTQAAEEFQKCLEIEKENLDHPNRRIAETHFDIGVAFDNAEKVEESASAFQESENILQEFQKKLSDKEGKTTEDETEIKELESVLEEIKTRITEVKQKEPKEAQTSDGAGSSSSNGVTTNGFGTSNGTTTVGFGGGSATTNGFHKSSENGDSTKETQDISHLIRKRPKENNVAESPSKKVRVEAAGCEN